MLYIKILKLLSEYLEKQALVLDASLEQIREQNLKWSAEEKWHLDTGRKFNELLGHYPISEDELLKMSGVLCDFVQFTRLTDIDNYFFVNGNREIPRLPFMLNNSYGDNEVWHDVTIELPPKDGLYYAKKDNTNSMYEVIYNNGIWKLSKYPTQEMKATSWAYWFDFH